MVGSQVLPACRALAHLVRESLHMARCDEDILLADCRAFDLVVALLDYVKLSPDILDPAFHHRTERAVVDKSRHRTVALRCRPDESSPFGQIHYFIIYVTHGAHRCVFISWVFRKKKVWRTCLKANASVPVVPFRRLLPSMLCIHIPGHGFSRICPESLKQRVFPPG